MVVMVGAALVVKEGAADMVVMVGAALVVKVGAADMVVMVGAALVVKVGAAAIVVTAGAKACGAATTWGAATLMVVVPENPLPPRFMVDMTGAAAIVVGILAKADISTRVLLRIAVWQNR